jgi:hypothetical protein
LLGLTAITSPASSLIGCSGGVEGGGSGGDGGQGGGQGGSGQVSSATGSGGTMSSSATVAPAYGVGMTDSDMDGYFNVIGGGDDCNDADASIHPGATETPGDSVDSNCDGHDDT